MAEPIFKGAETFSTHVSQLFRLLHRGRWPDSRHEEVFTSTEKRPSNIPPRHQEIIDLLLTGNIPEGLVFVPEGTYVEVKREGRAANFISCPAVLIEAPNTPMRCLHVTYAEIMEALRTNQFASPIDFQTFLRDLSSASSVTVLLTDSFYTGESREEELRQLCDLIQKKVNSGKTQIKQKLVPKDQFQLVITPQATSIWYGEENLGLV